MIKYYLTLTLFLLFFSCSDKNKDNLASNPTINEIFSTTEIKDLIKVLTFFEKQICNSQQHIDIDELSRCYSNYFERLEIAADLGSIEIKIPYTEQEQLYEQLEEATFNELWVFGKLYHNRTEETLKSITFKYDGKYAAFLEALGKDDPVVFEYYDAFSEAGDISPSMVVGLIKNYNTYDISDIRIRLLVAMHYLTMNDQYERKEKYEE